MSRVLIYGGPAFVAGALLWAVATVSLWTVPLTVILWWAMWAGVRLEALEEARRSSPSST